MIIKETVLVLMRLHHMKIMINQPIPLTFYPWIVNSSNMTSVMESTLTVNDQELSISLQWMLILDTSTLKNSDGVFNGI